MGPVGSGSRSGSRSLRLRLRLRCGAVDAVGGSAVVPIVEICVNRRERQSAINKEGKGLQGGIKRKCQKMGV